MSGMNFNGQKKSFLSVLRGRERPAWAPVEHELIEIPGRVGAFKKSKKIKVRQVNVPVVIKGKDIADIQKLKEELAAWLITDEPAPLVFDDEPDRTYYAEVTGSFEPEEIVTIGTGVISFICPDAYKYGIEQGPYLFDQDAITINNTGTAEAYPIIEATAKQSATSFMVTKGDEEYFMIGQPYDIDKEVLDQYPEVASWGMESLTGWSHMTEGFFLDDEVTGGTVSGSTLEVESSTNFIASTYGTTRTGWYGPAVRTSLPKAVGDFSITLGVSASNDGKGIGKVMAICLDENDDIVCSVGLINTRLGTKNVRVLARMNDGQNIKRTRVMDYHGDSGPESTVFSGVPLNIRLRREGNKFEAYTWQVKDGVPHARHGETIISNEAGFQRPIRQVVLFFAKYGNNQVFPMRIYGLKVQENNTLLLDESMIPYICHEGDIVKVDTQNELVMINEEVVTDLKNFGADYFMLDKGENHLFTFPEGAFDTTIKWRDRYK